MQSSVNLGDTDTTVSPVQITVAASTPTVTVSKSGPNASFFLGDLVTLSANITNPDGNTDAEYTYLWTQASGRTDRPVVEHRRSPDVHAPGEWRGADDDGVLHQHCGNEPDCCGLPRGTRSS